MQNPVPISSHITKLVLGFYKAMRLLFPYNFVAVNSRMPIWSTEGKVQSQYYRRMRNEREQNRSENRAQDMKQARSQSQDQQNRYESSENSSRMERNQQNQKNERSERENSMRSKQQNSRLDDRSQN